MASPKRGGESLAPELHLLDESEESFRLLVDSVLDYAIYMLDPDGNVISWNAGAQRLKGWQSREILGRHVSVFHTAESVAEGRPQHELRVAREQGVFREEARRQRKDGSEFFADITLTALYDKNRTLRGFAKVTRDITERKLAEQRMAEQNKALQAVNAELQSFAYSVAHDLRAPLRAMRGFSQALMQDYGTLLDDTGLDYLQRIAGAAVRMDDLIEDLLSYARLGQEELPLKAVSLNVVAEVAKDQVSALAREAGGTILVEESLPVVRGNLSVLIQILVNFLSNGLKFTKPGVAPVVRIWSEQDEYVVRVWVEDNGIGIAPEHHARVFEVFQRLHGVGQYEGTGIGLAVVRKGVERMGGKVGMESQLGNGSRFWFELAKG
jgi:PAS domain S-box-containing protein